jgi:glycosyltransferase involved in cell wall biosynthesis
VADRRLRILEVLEATVGGTKKHLLDLCRGLDPARFEITAALSFTRDPSPQQTRAILEEAGVAVLEIPMQRGPSPAGDRRALRALRDLIGELQPDVVHTHSTKAGLVGRAACRQVGFRRVLYTPHGFSFQMNVAAPLRCAYAEMERNLARSTYRIIAVCESERQLALRWRICEPQRCVVIPNGIEFRPPPAIVRAAKLEKLGLTPDVKLILCVGDLRPQKGHLYAVGALPAVLRQYPNTVLAIAGSGELERALEARAKALGVRDHLLLLGLRSDVPELLVCCDVFCQPSLWEGCPYAVIEAAGMDCAVVGSAVPGITDLVQDGVTGWLVPPGNSEALAQALLSALADRQERRRRGQAAAQYVRTRHSIEQMVAQTAKLYEETAQAKVFGAT